MRYRRLLMGGFLAVGLAVTAASGAMAEQIIAINSTVEAVDGPGNTGDRCQPE